MKRIRDFFILVIIVIIFTACSKLEPQSAEANLYDGRALSIGIIGETPQVLEEQVTFVKIQFSDLEKEMFGSQYDAIFITKNNLSEASQGKYAPIYKKSKIPFFFIQTEKGYVPFIENDLPYDNAPMFDDQSYATGILFNGDIVDSWGYGLYNDIENQANIKDVYSRIFVTISQNITQK